MGLDVSELVSDALPDLWAVVERLDRLDDSLRRIEELMRSRMPTVMPPAFARAEDLYELNGM